MEIPSTASRTGFHPLPSCDERSRTISGPSANIAFRNTIPPVDFDRSSVAPAFSSAGFHVAAQYAPPSSGNVHAKSRRVPAGLSCRYCKYCASCAVEKYTARNIANRRYKVSVSDERAIPARRNASAISAPF